MMRRKIAALLVGALMVPLLVACGNGEANGAPGTGTPGTGTPGSGDNGGGPGGLPPVELRYDFNDGELGWIPGFSDYSPEIEVEERAGVEPLPDSLEQTGTGFLLSGMNRSDDLFMFLKRRLTTEDGILAGQAYRVTYRLSIASNAPTGCMGIGGAPGESVFLKAGAVVTEPEVELRNGQWELTVDKDNQSAGGEDVWLIGDVANGIDCDEALDADSPFVTIEREYMYDSTVTVGEDGELWLIVGTDSGFEGQTDLYYQVIEVVLEPVTA